ncbi:MAG TPA: ABC transporter ATP-binding protein/permease [Candidatus Stackebrandtia excrementipullorum]|nr:ABC transporter ATP-binding protein/permease [Candidatus Stackebrandtia excrementipullorum]
MLTTGRPDPGTPDTGSPLAYLWWLVKSQPLRCARGGLWGTLWMVGLMMPPLFISHAIDNGLRPGNVNTLIAWSAAIVALGAANAGIGLLRHRTMTFVRLDASCRTIAAVTRHTARVGAALPRRVSTGEAVNIGTTDITQIAMVLTMVGPGVGAVIAYIVVAALTLAISPLLALVVLIGVPAVVVAVGPLLTRLQRTEAAYRHQQGHLTARAGDIVSGLRILRGVGGESLFLDRYRSRSAAMIDEGYRVGRFTSWITSLSSGIPAVLVAAVTWLGARMVVTDQISIGDLVAVYGYCLVLVVPVSFLIESGYDLTRGRVAAARVIDILNVPADVTDHHSSLGPPHLGDLTDPASGLTVTAGSFTAIAATDPADATTIADRLARFTDSTATLGKVRLTDMAISDIRRRIHILDNDAYLFSGALRDMTDPWNGNDTDHLASCIHAAVADDIVEGLPDGLDTPIATQARTLSGGQRQRIRLARALMADPETLILIDATSAVDSPTEAVIADRLRAHRAHKTTIVVTTSPALLDLADEVAFITDGHVTAVGSHHNLLHTQPAYHRLVDRSLGENGTREAT